MDLFIVVFYLISTLFLGIYFGQNIKTLKDFATSGGYSTNVLLATLFATVIGGGSTLGIVTNVHRYGIIFMALIKNGWVSKN
jgi:Na+/proline symporter